jgi:hypothetical protein
MAPSPRVFVSGSAIATTVAPYVVAGCGFAPPGGNGPCVSAQWVGAARVQSLNSPVVIATGASTCAPTGTPLTVLTVQTRVIAT